MKSFGHIILLCFLFWVNYNSAQTLHSVALVGMSFSPADLTISLGDTVKWTNNGGAHNVEADDGSFTSGSTSTSIWVYRHVFTSTGNFRYYCEEHGGPNGVGMAGIIRVQPATGVDDESIKLNYKLLQNYPNPFNPSTKIQYSIPRSEYVTLKIYNVMGTLNKTLISEYQPGGDYIVDFDASYLSSGVYFYQLRAGNFISTKRMLLLK